MAPAAAGVAVLDSGANRPRFERRAGSRRPHQAAAPREGSRGLGRAEVPRPPRSAPRTRAAASAEPRRLTARLALWSESGARRTLTDVARLRRPRRGSARAARRRARRGIAADIATRARGAATRPIPACPGAARTRIRQPTEAAPKARARARSRRAPPAPARRTAPCVIGRTEVAKSRCAESRVSFAGAAPRRPSRRSRR